MPRKFLQLLFLVLVISLTACGAGSQLDSETKAKIAELVNQPTYMPVPADITLEQRCFGMYQDPSKYNVEIVGFKILTLDSNGLPKEAEFIHRAPFSTDSSQDQRVSTTLYTNAEEIWQCIIRRMPEWHSSDQPAPVPTGFAVPAATSMPAQQAQQLPPVVNFDVTPRWELGQYDFDPNTGKVRPGADGNPIVVQKMEFGTEAEAQQYFDSASRDGYFVPGYYQQVMLDSNFLRVELTPKREYQPYKAPVPVERRSTSLYSFVDPSTGLLQYFRYLQPQQGVPESEVAVSAAEKQEQAVSIQMFSGDSAPSIVWNVPAADLPSELPNLDAQTPFYGVQNPDGSYTYFSEEELPVVEKQLMATEQGGTIFEFKRNKNQPISTAIDVAPWTIPHDLSFAAEDGTWDITQPYWLLSQTGKLFPNYEAALRYANNLYSTENPRIYTGGSLVEMVRNKATGKSEEVQNWELPAGLATGRDANEPYYLNFANNKAYDNSLSARFDNGFGGYISFLTGNTEIGIFTREHRNGSLKWGVLEWSLVIFVSGLVLLLVVLLILKLYKHFHEKKKATLEDNPVLPPALQRRRDDEDAALEDLAVLHELHELGLAARNLFIFGLAAVGIYLLAILANWIIKKLTGGDIAPVGVLVSVISAISIWGWLVTRRKKALQSVTQPPESESTPLLTSGEGE